MDPDDQLSGLFDDLEQQAAGLHLAEREAEVAELAEAEYADVTLLARLHAAVGHPVRLRLVGGTVAQGALQRVGSDWLQLDVRGRPWVVRLQALTGVTGLPDRAVTEEARPLTAHLSLRSGLRALGRSGRECVVQLVDGTRLVGLLGRVGRDFVELRPPGRATAGDPAGAASAAELVPLHQLACARKLE
jgi:hypothetical protein